MAKKPTPANEEAAAEEESVTITVTMEEESVVLQAAGLKLTIMRSAMRKHEDFLMRQRRALDGVVPAAVHDIDAQLSVLREEVFADLRIEDEDEEKSKARVDPKQMELDDAAPDYGTHSCKNVGETRALIARLIDDAPSPGVAVIALNRLEDGEREREAGPRQSHLDAIRDARTPLAKKATALVDGDGRPAPDLEWDDDDEDEDEDDDEEGF